MAELYPNLQKAVLSWRKANDLTLKEFSKLFGLSRVSMSSKLNGKTDFTLPEAVKVCNMIGISLDDATSDQPIECTCYYAIGGSD